LQLNPGVRQAGGVALVAQVTGGSDFDFFWEQKAAAAWRLLREASDVWASQGRGSLDVAIALGRFMMILARPGGWPPLLQLYWPPRFLLEPPPLAAADSVLMLSPRCNPQQASAAIQSLLVILGKAADEWSIGHPEEPKTRDVLNEMLATLWQYKIAPHPPSKAYPREL
jgi:hypothetical protein